MVKGLSVIGLGKLGLSMAAFLANKSFKVIGVDVDSEIIKAVNEKRCPRYEPGVSELLNSSGRTLVATRACAGARDVGLNSISYDAMSRTSKL